MSDLPRELHLTTAVPLSGCVVLEMTIFFLPAFITSLPQMFDFFAGPPPSLFLASPISFSAYATVISLTGQALFGRVRSDLRGEKVIFVVKK